MPKRKTDEPEAKPIKTYGMEFFPDKTQFDYDQAAFAGRLPMSSGTPPRYELFKQIADFITPGLFEWHDWTERAIRPLLPDTDERKITIVRAFPGCSNAAKTFNITCFACVWWLMWPEESSVTLVSTTKHMLRRRGWAEVQRVYSSLRDGQRFGNLLDSRTLWQAQKADDRHAVVAQSVEEGGEKKVVDNLKGIHTRRQMLIIDEATSIPKAIYEACDNLYSYPDEFIVAVMGNPLDRLDNFGLLCEPNKGWSSVNVESGEWEARPFAKCGYAKPLVVTFDAEKSPNITEGRVVSRHLPKKDTVEAAKLASNGGKTALYWQNMRGFWPPEGLIATVFAPSMFDLFDAVRSSHEFNQGFFLLAALDPARDGGDTPMLRITKMGMLGSGVYGLQNFKVIPIPVDANSKKPIAYQIVEQVMEHCKKVEISAGEFKEVRPSCFIMDDSSDGALGDVFMQLWSHSIVRVAFQESASTDVVSIEDQRPANEVYHNKRAEMYFYARSVLLSGQYKGVDEETQREICGIKYDGSRKRTVLQDKHEYRAEHGGKSPDLSDTFCMTPELARRHGFKLKATGETKKVIEENEIKIEKTQEIFHEENMYQPEEMPDETDAVQNFL